MKVCSKCRIKKKEEEFSKSKNNKDGLHYWCKVCCKKYYKNNGDKRKEYLKDTKDKRKEYYENNKDKIREYQKEYLKEYRKNNKDKVSERGKEYYKKNKEKRKKYNKKWYEINEDKIREHSKSSALYDTYIHQISYAELTRHSPENYDLLQIKCAYCRKWFNPTIQNVHNRIQALEGHMRGKARFYCSEDCKSNCSIYNRSKYPKNFKVDRSREVQSELRDLVFERDEWTCIKCGETVGLQCHHIEGIQWNPIESADMDICVTFCTKCHEDAHKDEGCRYYDLQCRNKE